MYHYYSLHDLQKLGLMKKYSLLLLLLSYFTIAQTLEHKYATNEQTPHWIQLMYAPNADVGKVMAAYESYYKKHKLVKNEHTQYYKRWVRKMSRDFRGIDYGANPALVAKNERKYQAQSLQLRAEKGPNAQWQGIGPFDFDKEAASRSYAAGAAHVYTVEQSMSNPDVLYAGTATAGVWKSEDKGENWFLLTQNLLLSDVLAIEIDHSNDQVVYFESGGTLYKTTNSGGTWLPIGDAAFQNTTHEITDIVMHPTDTQQLFIASNQGLYRTDNGGNSFTQLVAGVFQEIEFHPADNNIVYAVRQVNNISTTFY